MDANEAPDKADGRARSLRNLKPFVKGDPRINRKGRPRSFDEWRKLTIEILREPARDAEGKPIIIDGHIVTNAEMIARTWLRDRKRQQALIEAAFGKVPERVELSGRDGKAIEVTAYDYYAAIAEIAPGSSDDSETSREAEDSRRGAQVGQDDDGG